MAVSRGSERPEIDWVAAERSPEFRELVKRKKAFVLPATVFFLAWYFGFIVLAGYAPDFMGEEFLFDGFTIGYAAGAQPVRDDLGARRLVPAQGRQGVRPARRARRTGGAGGGHRAPAAGASSVPPRASPRSSATRVR